MMFGWWAGPMLRTHRAGKGPGRLRGWGLGSSNRRGPGVSSTSGLRGQGTSPGSPAGFLGSSGRGKPLLSFPAPLVWGLGRPRPPASPDLPGLPPMPPRAHAAWRGVWRAGDRPGRSAGVPLISLGVRAPHQRPAGALVVGRH